MFVANVCQVSVGRAANCSKFVGLQRQSFCLQSFCAYVAPRTRYQRKTEGIVGCLRRRDGCHQPGRQASGRRMSGAPNRRVWTPLAAKQEYYVRARFVQFGRHETIKSSIMRCIIIFDLASSYDLLPSSWLLSNDLLDGIFLKAIICLCTEDYLRYFSLQLLSKKAIKLTIKNTFSTRQLEMLTDIRIINYPEIPGQ